MENIQQNIKTCTHSAEFLKKRKFYMAIPLLVLPFITMAFWALGGGKDAAIRTAANPGKGIDLILPSAQFKIQRQAPDKMEIYQSAARDTTKEKDGPGKSFIQAMSFKTGSAVNKDTDKTVTGISSLPASAADRQSARIEARLAQLHKQLSQQEPAAVAPTLQATDPETRHLSRMMKSMKASGGDDPEMRQLGDMLSKIQAIQNPASVKISLKQKKDDNSPFRAMPAVIDGKQKVLNGGTVKLKLTDSVRLKGILLQKGQLLFGACQVTNQRLLLTIQNIRVGKSIMPADLTIFSLDGMPGIPAPEAALASSAGTGANNAIENIQLMGMDGSIGSQAAASGLNAAKDLLGKKVKKIKVKLKDNLPVLLKDNSRKN